MKLCDTHRLENRLKKETTSIPKVINIILYLIYLIEQVDYCQSIDGGTF